MSVKPTLQEQLQNNLGGNLNNKFGMTLPVPFIENIIIDEDGENITVKAAMYFNMDDYGDLNFGDFTGSLGDLNFYAMLAFNREYYDGTQTEGADADLSTDTHLTELINGDKEILSAVNSFWAHWKDENSIQTLYYPDDSEASMADNLYSFEKISKWELVDTYYNAGGTPIKKILTELSIPISEAQLPQTADTYNFLDYIEGNSSYTTSRETIKDVGILTFSTALSIRNDTETTDADATIWDDLWNMNITDPDNPMIDFYSSMTSDINSFVFFKDGSITPPDQTIFVTGDGTIVEEPIMGLDLRYHYSDKLTIPILIDYFRPLTGTSEDNTLQTMLDSLSTILETSGNDPQLLVKINAFLQSFADKSSATAIGQFYGRVLERLTKANTAVIKGPIASKQLINNPTVIDLRGTKETSTYNNEIFDVAIEATDFIYTNSVMANRLTGSIRETEECLVDQGSFFFDFEKLLKQKSNLSEHLNVQKVEDLFGSAALCNRFYIENVTMEVVSNFSDGAQASLSLDFDLNDRNIPSSSFGIYKDSSTQDPNSLADQYVVEDLDMLPYLYLRNFNLVNDSLNTLNNDRFYKLMCFQYQHVIKDYNWSHSSRSTHEGGSSSTYRNFDEDYYYRINIRMRDSTNTIYVDLYNLAYDIRELLDEYHLLASEACSYNETDDFFNQFFIRGLEARYSENPSGAPWIKAAFMYTYLQDLWDNSHGGDRDEILSQAKNLSATVGPNGGTLTALETLVNNYNKLMSDLFPDAEEGTLELDFNIYSGSDEYRELELTADITDFPDSSPLEEVWETTSSPPAEWMNVGGWSGYDITTSADSPSTNAAFESQLISDFGLDTSTDDAAAFIDAVGSFCDGYISGVPAHLTNILGYYKLGTGHHDDSSVAIAFWWDLDVDASPWTLTVHKIQTTLAGEGHASLITYITEVAGDDWDWGDGYGN